MKNRLVTNNTYFLSFHASPMKIVDFLDATLGLMTTQAKTMNGSIIKAITRIDQPNPKLEAFKNLESAIGKTMPPMLDPETARPRAAARRLSKYWLIMAKAGVWRNATEGPIRRDWAKMNLGCRQLVGWGSKRVDRTDW